jgi:hypothetical protein
MLAHQVALPLPVEIGIAGINKVAKAVGLSNGTVARLKAEKAA